MSSVVDFPVYWHAEEGQIRKAFIFFHNASVCFIIRFS